MPLYEYECDKCGEITDAHRSVENRNDCPPCRCGGTTHKIISYGKSVSDLTPYYDDNLESWVDSKRHRRKLMRDQGVEENYGKGWR